MRFMEYCTGLFVWGLEVCVYLVVGGVCVFVIKSLPNNNAETWSQTHTTPNTLNLHHKPQLHTPPTTRWAQPSNPYTNRPVQYSIDCTDKHQYNTAYSHYTHTSYYLIIYSAENHMLQLNI